MIGYVIKIPKHPEKDGPAYWSGAVKGFEWVTDVHDAKIYAYIERAYCVVDKHLDKKDWENAKVVKMRI